MRKFFGCVLAALYGAGLIYVDKSALEDPTMMWKYQINQIKKGL